MKMNQDEILTIRELSTYLKISRSTLYKLAQEGCLPAQKIGRHWRFHKGAIEEWIQKTNQPRKKASKSKK